jgi:hypothetical protein
MSALVVMRRFYLVDDHGECRVAIAGQPIMRTMSVAVRAMRRPGAAFTDT